MSENFKNLLWAKDETFDFESLRSLRFKSQLSVEGRCG